MYSTDLPQAFTALCNSKIKWRVSNVSTAGQKGTEQKESQNVTDKISKFSFEIYLLKNKILKNTLKKILH